MRAIVPAAIGVTAGGGLTFRWILNRFLQRAVEEIVVHTGNLIIPSLIGFDLDISQILDFIWYSGGVLICWELRVEIFFIWLCTSVPGSSGYLKCCSVGSIGNVLLLWWETRQQW